MSDSNSGSGNGLKRARSSSPVNGTSSNGNGGKKQNTGKESVEDGERSASAAAMSPPAPAAREDAAAPTASASAGAEVSPTITIRALIVTQDASIIIGKGGSHIKEIREKAGAKVSVTEAVPGTVERVLLVTGPLDAVSKAYGLIVRKINDEPYDQPSVPGSRAVTIK